MMNEIKLIMWNCLCAIARIKCDYKHLSLFTKNA